MSTTHEVYTPNPKPPVEAQLDAALAPMPTVRAIFSDIDGTIVHYDNKLMPAQGYELLRKVTDGSDDSTGLGRESGYFLHRPSGREVKCWRVPSLTLGGGYISARTLELVDQLRDEHGVHFILMTGARTSTMLMRRQSHTLPLTTYDVCEGGGKMWRRDAGPNDAPEGDGEGSINIDAEWSNRFVELCGPVDQLETEPRGRVGQLWDIYRKLDSEGYHLDAKSFSTSFLVDLSKSRACLDVEKGGEGRSVDEVEAEIKLRFSNGEFGDGKSFWYVTNLGKGQVVANGSGKHASTEYIFAKLGIDGSTSVALFDDENDLEFADMCAAGFIPSVAHGSVVPAVEKTNALRGHDAFLRTPIDGPIGTDMALEAILRRVVKAKQQ